MLFYGEKVGKYKNFLGQIFFYGRARPIHFTLLPAEKNIDAGGRVVQKKEFSSQMIVLPQFVAMIV